MGLNIGEIIPKKAIELKDLRGKVLAIDASNIIYQFLSSIRQADGTPLHDKKGKITSHLSGLFYRNVSLLNERIKLIYVFDGKPPELKYGTKEARGKVKKEAEKRYEKAKSEEDVTGMGKYAKQLARMTPEIAEESKELLKALGIPVVQAPSEGEAQAAYLAKSKKIYAIGSQDYDSLLFGAPILIQNLTLARRRKTYSGWTSVNPELIELDNVFNKLQINMDQLICLGILAGTDYNPKGVPRIGQKKALEIVRKYKYPVRIFESVGENLDFDWKQIFELFHKPKIKKTNDIKFPKLNEDAVRKILIKREFSEERVEKQLDKLRQAKERGKQRTLF